MPRLTLLTCALTALSLHHAAAARGTVETDQSLADFSLEQLSDIAVTSVSRQETRLAEAPASIYVISGDSIRRSGAINLPEALRLAPNLQVARADSHTYAITARGFSSTLENKLLVMIDGRSVYSPLFSGVFWDMQDVVMDDIERIEVISGPGATIWGANAVNGVINIITKSARATQGTLAGATLGNHGREVNVRSGARLANGASYRVYAKAVARDSVDDGVPGDSDWRRTQAGFRIDWDGPGPAMTISGDAYSGAIAQRRNEDITITGANLLGRMTMRLAGGSDVRLQAYLDHTERNQPGAGAQRLDTLDLEAQHGVALDAANRLAWGGGVRMSLDRIDNGQFVFVPASRPLHWANLFAQDEWTIAPGLRLTGGLKLEHNVYTGLESLPSVRVAWSPHPDTLWWSAASRTVRAPSRIDRDLTVPAAGVAPGSVPNLIDASPQYVSETAQVLELGYRAQPAAGLAWSATVFYSDYARLRTLEPRVGQGAVFANLGRGYAQGVELSASLQVLPDWRLEGGAVVQRIASGIVAASADLAARGGLVTSDPSNYWSVRSSHDLSDRLKLDFALRHMGSLPAPAVPSYTELDARLAWQWRPEVEFAVSGRNLLHPGHAEFGAVGTRQPVERTVLVSATLRY